VAVVNGGGTAKGFGEGFPYLIAGKTGTAERFSRSGEEWENIMDVAVERHEVLFEAFAPADDARIAVIVALEAGHTGATDAAPIARKILDAWLKDDDVRLVGGTP
jgi:penicillin-binding protein 2